jgi:hypothetical protein
MIRDMKHADPASPERSSLCPRPDVVEPCAWCGLPAVLTIDAVRATLDCGACGASVELGEQPRESRRSHGDRIRIAA